MIWVASMIASSLIVDAMIGAVIYAVWRWVVVPQPRLRMRLNAVIDERIEMARRLGRYR